MFQQFLLTLTLAIVVSIVWVQLSAIYPLGAFVLALIGGPALLIWSVFVEPRQLRVRLVSLEIDSWPTRLNGTKIGIIGCLHAGAPFINQKKLDHIIEAFEKEKPDLIVLLGDQVASFVLGGSRMSLEEVARRLSRLGQTSPLLAVLGNHDFARGASAVKLAMEAQNIVVLENTSIDLKQPELVVAGLKYGGNTDDNLQETMNSSGTAPLLLLAHSPDVFPLVSPTVPLTLAAHTHGGQVRLPLFGPLVVPSKYGRKFAAGIYRDKGRALFVTSGVGTSILPMRLNTPPEVVVLTVSGSS